MPWAVRLYDDDGNVIGGDIDHPLFMASQDLWRISTLTYNTANNSSVTFVVPAATEYQILGVYVSYTSTGTAGNRQLAVQALNADNSVIVGVRAGVVQAASLTRNYQFGAGLVQDAAFRDTDYASVALPPIMLGPGQKLKIYDNKAVDAAADDLVIQVQIASRSIG